LIPPTADVHMPDILPVPPQALNAHRRSSAANCARIRDLGFTTSKHIKMYGERFELVSDPFEDGACTAIRALRGTDPTIRTLRLPVSILIGLSDRFRKN
jgi:hypothetical protein